MAARILSAVVGARHIYSGFGETACGPMYLTKKTTQRALADADNWRELTVTTSPIGLPDVVVVEQGPNWSDNFFNQGIGWLWAGDPGYAPGTYVSYRKFRRDIDPDSPEFYQIEYEFELSDPYSEEDAMADFMALLDQVDVSDPANPVQSLCNFSRGWGFAYQNGVIADIGNIGTTNVLLCDNRTFAPLAGPFAGITIQRSGTPTGPYGYHDMGTNHGGSIVGRKARVRMDTGACIWKWATPWTCVGPNPPFDQRCPEPTCLFIALPSQDNPDPLCPLVWRRYVEFLLEPGASHEWYGIGGCTACFGRS